MGSESGSGRVPRHGDEGFDGSTSTSSHRRWQHHFRGCCERSARGRSRPDPFLSPRVRTFSCHRPHFSGPPPTTILGAGPTDVVMTYTPDCHTRPCTGAPSPTRRPRTSDGAQPRPRPRLLGYRATTGPASCPGGGDSRERAGAAWPAAGRGRRRHLRGRGLSPVAHGPQGVASRARVAVGTGACGAAGAAGARLATAARALGPPRRGGRPRAGSIARPPRPRPAGNRPRGRPGASRRRAGRSGAR